jgi:uncharacterized membrane protein YgcG
MVLAPSKSYLTSKAGPLPIWAWMGVGLGGALTWALYSAHKKAAAAAAAGNLAGTPGYTLPSNIQPQNTTVNETDFSQVVSGTPWQHPPGGGRPYGRGSLAPISPGHDGPPPDPGVMITSDQLHSTLANIAASLGGAAEAEVVNMIMTDPRNADALSHVNPNQPLPPGLSIWMPSSLPGAGPGGPGRAPGSQGRGDGRRGGPSTGPGPTSPGGGGFGQQRGGQQHGGSGYQAGGQRSGSYGGR